MRWEEEEEEEHGSYLKREPTHRRVVGKMSVWIERGHQTWICWGLKSNSFERGSRDGFGAVWDVPNSLGGGGVTWTFDRVNLDKNRPFSALYEFSLRRGPGGRGKGRGAWNLFLGIGHLDARPVGGFPS